MDYEEDFLDAMLAEQEQIEQEMAEVVSLLEHPLVKAYTHIHTYEPCRKPWLLCQDEFGFDPNEYDAAAAPSTQTANKVAAASAAISSSSQVRWSSFTCMRSHHIIIMIIILLTPISSNPVTVACQRCRSEEVRTSRL